MAWQRRHGYGKRSLVETAFSRIKTINGRRLTSRIFGSQQNEITVHIKIANRNMLIARPDAGVIAGLIRGAVSLVPPNSRVSRCVTTIPERAVWWQGLAARQRMSVRASATVSCLRIVAIEFSIALLPCGGRISGVRTQAFG